MKAYFAEKVHQNLPKVIDSVTKKQSLLMTQATTDHGGVVATADLDPSHGMLRLTIVAKGWNTQVTLDRRVFDKPTLEELERLHAQAMEALAAR